jgi:hypothetical protein
LGPPAPPPEFLHLSADPASGPSKFDKHGNPKLLPRAPAAPGAAPAAAPPPAAGGAGAAHSVSAPAAAAEEPEAAAPAGPAPGGDSLQAQLSALLALKAALDTQGWMRDWAAGRGAAGEYCARFAGVQCDAEKNVVGIGFREGDPLGGTLPPASVLKAFPRLKFLWLGETYLTGTLPADWGELDQLEDLRLGNNQLKGRLPREWAGMARLKKLYLL